MNTQEVHTLLDKYYRGETSDEDEIKLREYFSEGNIAPEFEDEREIFAFYNYRGKAPGPSENFEKAIISAVDRSEGENPRRFVRRVLYTVISSAAALLLLVASYLLLIRESEPSDTFSDPSLAYAETVKILFSVSGKLNTGIGALEPVKKFETTLSKSMGTVTRSTGLIENNLRSLDYFQRAVNIVNSPLETIKK
jgi:hypothetical protein